jgi:transitional endoplasmic reticulum ATPase
MPGALEISKDARIARIREVRQESTVLYVEFENGSFGTVRTSEGAFAHQPGDVLLIWTDENRIAEASRELWRDEKRVGVVKLRLEDVTVVDEGSRWRVLETQSTPAYAVGNTVLIGSDRVVRVLDDKPLRFLDLGQADNIALDHFKVKPGAVVDSFDDFGGMSHVIARAKALIEVPLTKAALLRQIGARPIKGVLFTGPPGTGKTMLARIIANRSQSAFYKVSGPEVMSKWYGESEAILRRIFEDAGEQQSAIVFFDEIDAVAARRSDGSHEASQRFVAQFLALMDGFTSSGNVVVIAATNRPDSLDPALRRPGRFDWEIVFELPNPADREIILRTSARRLSAAEGLPHARVAAQTDGWSGAELTGIWSEAALLAAADDRSMIKEEDYLEGHRRVLAARQAKGRPK